MNYWIFFFFADQSNKKICINVVTDRLIEFDSSIFLSCIKHDSASLLFFPVDDGKLFQGSGVGDPFGPRCFEGDIMGCGIMFPRDFNLDGGGEHFPLFFF